MLRISPIQSLYPNTFHTKSSANNTSSTSPIEADEPVDWCCSKCSKHFLAPKIIRNKIDNKPIETLVCPYCDSGDIWNNKAQCFKEKLWKKI